MVSSLRDSIRTYILSLLLMPPQDVTNQPREVSKCITNCRSQIDGPGHITQSTTIPVSHSRVKWFLEKCHIILHALVVLKPLVLLKIHLTSCSSRMIVVRHTQTQNVYSNPLCLCALRVNFNTSDANTLEKFVFLFCTVPNTGLVLWCQQFCALFLKRFYNSLRFWQAIITQLVLPLLFVLIAMILAVTLPNANENDPSRPLKISNSALVPDSQLVFFATLGDVPSNSLDFSVSY